MTVRLSKACHTVIAKFTSCRASRYASGLGYRKVTLAKVMEPRTFACACKVHCANKLLCRENKYNGPKTQCMTYNIALRQSTERLVTTQHKFHHIPCPAPQPIFGITLFVTRSTSAKGSMNGCRSKIEKIRGTTLRAF